MQDGVWGADSIDALKRFQKDQNLDGDGKLGALSLIGLGLGPKRAPPETMQPAADSSGIQSNLPAPQQP